MSAGAPTRLDRFIFGCALVVFALLSVPLAFGGSIGLWLMQCVPLLLTLPGIRRQERRSLQWLCFLLLFHFTVGVLQLFHPVPAVRWLGAATTLACIVLFAAAIVRMRRPTQE